MRQLDSYLKDTAISFLLFWVYLGPTVYRAYAKNEKFLGTEKKEAAEVEDKYAEILIKSKERKKDESKITFDEYEQFLERLERQNKLHALASENPKEMRLQADEEVQRRMESMGK